MKNTLISHLVLFSIIIVLIAISVSPELPASVSNSQDKIKKADAILRFLKDSNSAKTRNARPDIKDDSDPLRLEIPFNFNSSELTSEAKIQLDELGKALGSEGLRNLSIKLVGHTDERGTDEYNRKLSQRRVESAKRYLLSAYQINPDLIICLGYGKSHPIIANANTEAEHALNRRVEIQPANTQTDENLSLNKEDRQLEESKSEKSDVKKISAGKLQLQWGVFHEGKNHKDELIRYNGNSVLMTNDAYRVYVKPEKSCFVYVYQVDSKSKGIWLFPRKDLQEQNPLSADDHWLPSRSKRFTLDSTIGTETIYLIASDTPADDLESIVNSGHMTASSDVVTQTIKTRGVGQIKIGPPPGSGEEKSISIIDQSPNGKKGLTVGSIPPKDVFHVISNTADFYTVITFRHE